MRDSPSENEIVVSTHMVDGSGDLVLRSLTGREVDESEIAAHLSRMPDIAEIRSMTVQHSSMVKNLLFLRALPALERVQVNGFNLRTFDGVEAFQGDFISIDTGKNQRRAIGKISGTRIKRLTVHWGNTDDMEAIGGVRTLEYLLLWRCPRLSLASWRDLPLKSIQLFGGTIEELADTAQIRELRSLTLAGHRKLQRFSGDNHRIEALVIQDSNAVDFGTTATFSGVRNLSIVNIKNALALSTFGKLSQLQSLSLMKCKPVFDTFALKTSAPLLRDLHILKLPKEMVVKLSQANPGVRVSNGDWVATDGELRRQ